MVIYKIKKDNIRINQSMIFKYRTGIDFSMNCKRIIKKMLKAKKYFAILLNHFCLKKPDSTSEPYLSDTFEIILMLRGIRKAKIATTKEAVIVIK